MASFLFLVYRTRRSLLANISHKCLRAHASKFQSKVSPLLLQRCTYCVPTSAYGEENPEKSLESKLKNLGHVTRVLPTPFDTLQVVKELQKAGRKSSMHEMWWHGTVKLLTGFGLEQAEGLSRVLVSILNLSSQQVAQNQVTLRDLVRADVLMCFPRELNTLPPFQDLLELKLKGEVDSTR